MATVGRFFISQASIVRLRGIKWASSGPLSGIHSACGFRLRAPKVLHQGSQVENSQ